MILNLGLIIGSYLLGAIPTGLILSRTFAKIDVREHGSHNIGATNVYRSAGKKLGLLTLLGDVLKGFLPVYGVAAITGSELWTCFSAGATFLGHLYPVYLKFSGGKGVATALGVFLVLAPKAVLFSLAVFILVLLGFRYVSLSSVAAAFALPIFMLFSSLPYSLPYLLTATAIAIMIAFRHHENIKRLIKGEESKLGSKKS